MQLIGIDCATEDKRTGVALADFDQSASLVVKAAKVCSREESALEVVRSWLDSGTGDTLIALDAPLGWPRALSAGLAGHRAGAPLPGNRKELFWRDTDWVVKQRLGVRPLSVGADLIAHTAHAALEMLGPLGLQTGSPVPLAWTPPGSGIWAIEVYPAATLRAIGAAYPGYKKDRELRARVVEKINREDMDLQASAGTILANEHALDAVVCLLAARDFLLRRCVEPTDLELAKQEGWIWFRETDVP